MTCLQYFATAHTGYIVLLLKLHYVYYPQKNYLFQPPLFYDTQSTLEGSSGDTFNFAH